MVSGYMVTSEGRHGVRLTEMRFFSNFEDAKAYAKNCYGKWMVMYEVSDQGPPVKTHVWKEAP